MMAVTTDLIILSFFIDAHLHLRFSNLRMQEHAKSSKEMEALGAAAAHGMKAGTVIALVGGLGAGKTHWTKGFVAGLGSTSEVTSPTFGLVHEYRGGRLPVFHFDFYRLESAAELISLGWDEYTDSEAIIIAEWGDKFPEILPPQTHWLTFNIESDGSRTIG
jgi:tRNA threonylcarbamoyladenosine biosynthesis protein TsaE